MSGDEAFQKQAAVILALTSNEKSGHLGKLTAEEEQVLKEFREQHREKRMTDQDLLRFLRARQFNLKKASKMLEDTCEYRKQHQPDRLLVTDHVNICKQGLGFVQGVDKMGRPVVWYYFCNHDPAQHAQAWDFCVALLEMAIRALPPGSDGVTVCFDLTGYSRKNSDIKLAIKIVQTLQNHYPERMGMTLFMNAPTVFWLLWRVIRPFLDARTSAKILFVDGSNWQDKLHSLIDRTQLPAAQGGGLAMTPSTWIDQILRAPNGHSPSRSQGGSPVRTLGNLSPMGLGSPPLPIGYG